MRLYRQEHPDNVIVTSTNRQAVVQRDRPENGICPCTWHQIHRELRVRSGAPCMLSSCAACPGSWGGFESASLRRWRGRHELSSTSIKSACGRADQSFTQHWELNMSKLSIRQSWSFESSRRVTQQCRVQTARRGTAVATMSNGVTFRPRWTSSSFNSMEI